MRGDGLDVLLLGAAALFALTGYRQGLLVGLLSFVGFFGGGLVGTQLAAPVATQVATGAAQSVVGVAVVLAAAALGQLAAITVGHGLRRRLPGRGARALDSAVGALASATAALLVAWLVATPLASASYPFVAAQIRRSSVIAAVDRFVPDPVRTLFASFTRLVDRRGFPDVFGPLSPTRVAPAPAPDPAILRSRAVTAARPSIVKLLGTARSCSRRLEGSGFVYAPEHVLTNAHVVAGVDELAVLVGGRRRPGRVVLFDPDRDVAVVFVPALRASPLHFAGAAGPGTSAVVAGFPLDGPFSAIAARVRSRQQVSGPGIYADSDPGHQVTRLVYALRARVRSGNSGGPLLAGDGAVLGVVFAAAADDPDTGFALTASEVAGDARAGASASTPVSTRRCD